MWLVTDDVLELPSPKFQRYVVMLPSESEDPAASKFTSRGAVPVLTSTPANAIGRTLVPPPPGVGAQAVMTSASAAMALSSVTVIRRDDRVAVLVALEWCMVPLVPAFMSFPPRPVPALAVSPFALRSCVARTRV